MTRNELVAALKVRQGISEFTARNAVDNIMKIMTERLAAGEDVEISDFGKFFTRQRSTCMVKDIRTGAPVAARGKKRVVFKAFTKLRKAMNEDASGEDHDE